MPQQEGAIGKIWNFFGEPPWEKRQRLQRLQDEQTLADAASARRTNEFAANQEAQTLAQQRLAASRVFDQKAADRELQQHFANVNVAEGRAPSESFLSPQQNQNLAMIDASTDLSRSKAAVPLAESSGAMNMYNANLGAAPLMQSQGLENAQANISRSQAAGSAADTAGAVDRAVRYLKPLLAGTIAESDISEQANRGKFARARAPHIGSYVDTENLQNQAKGEEAADLTTRLQARDPKFYSDQVGAEQAGLTAQKAVNEATARYPGLSPSLHIPDEFRGIIKPEDLYRLTLNPGITNRAPQPGALPYKIRPLGTLKDY